MSISLSLTSLSFPASATKNSVIAKASKTQRINTVFVEKIEEMQMVDELLHPHYGIKLKIHEIKNILDFDGNEYTLVECKPTGYFIFHNESGNFVEYSVRTISPYLAKRDSLYYSGPGQYFYYDQQTTIDLITGNKLTEQDIILEQEESKKIQDLLVENTNKNVSDYIDGIAPLKVDQNSTLKNQMALRRSL